MKIVVTGATGYLGSFVSKLLLDEAGAQVLSLTRRAHPTFRSASSFVERTFAPGWEEEVRRFEPQAIIHSAAMASAAECEERPGAAFEANCDLTDRIARVACNSGAHLVVVSTDLVFDGSGVPAPGGFTESAEPRSLSVYARSKRAGELAALEASPSCSLVRTSLLYGAAIGEKAGPLGWMTESLVARRPITLFSDEWRTPVFVIDAARALIAAAAGRVAGVFHCAGPERLSRVQFGTITARGLGFDTALIESKRRADLPSVPPRPEDVSLNAAKAERVLKIQFKKASDVIPILRAELSENRG